MTTEPWLVVTAAQYKQGWTEIEGSPLTGGVHVHHRSFIVLRKNDDGTYLVRNPRLQKLETDMQKDGQ